VASGSRPTDSDETMPIPMNSIARTNTGIVQCAFGRISGTAAAVSRSCPLAAAGDCPLAAAGDLDGARVVGRVADLGDHDDQTPLDRCLSGTRYHSIE